MGEILTAAIIITLAILARMYQAHQHQKQLVTWLDATASMIGDLLRELISTQQPEETDDDNQNPLFK